MVVLRLDAHGARARAVGELDPSSWRGPNVGVEQKRPQKKTGEKQITRYNCEVSPCLEALTKFTKPTTKQQLSNY